MIEYLSGQVLVRLPQSLIVDVQGVGYGVEMPLSALCEAPPPGTLVNLWIDTYVREDALRLFGFFSFEDRQAFLLLRQVSGIGPKIALAILSTLDAHSLRQTILQNRLQLLESVPGIGKRTAERLILELKPKMEKISFASPIHDVKKSSSRPNGAESENQSVSLAKQKANLDLDMQLEQKIVDVRSALENLGYKERDISPVVAELIQNRNEEEIPEFQALLRSALKTIRAGVL